MSSHSTAWFGEAACLDEEPELFFPLTDRGPGHVQYERAKTVCRRCPVRAECLEFAVRTRQEHGVWGGTDPTERSSRRSAVRGR
ncbi:WhiB family transcriptional regulator [Nonomuraea sp. NPDC050556]|uniref:WhiB family transcriptional regulator n=1 Tax=Nonomuraea sp. NPDC050556 TaxID=3364369 RepID=UPI0037A56311